MKFDENFRYCKVTPYIPHVIDWEK